MPESGDTWVHELFWWCVRLLDRMADALGISYELLNVLIFVIAHPLATLALLYAVVAQRRTIARLRGG